MAGVELLQAGYLIRQFREEDVRVLDRDDLSAPLLDDLLCLLGQAVLLGPESRESAALASQQRSSQRSIPLGRPPTNDKTILFKNLVEKPVHLGGGGFELRSRVPDSRVTVVAMDLDH